MTTNRPQRNFVIEYKSNRRQSKSPEKSIWGTTDLKALTQAVADDMPIASAPSKDELASKSSPQEVTHADDVGDAPPAARMTLLKHDGPGVETSDLSEKAVKSTDCPASVPFQRKPKRRAGSKIAFAPEQSVDPIAVITAGSATTDVASFDCDTLAILEAENRQLKQLLRKKLRSENAHMRDMLRRY